VRPGRGQCRRTESRKSAGGVRLLAIIRRPLAANLQRHQVHAARRTDGGDERPIVEPFRHRAGRQEDTADQRREEHQQERPEGSQALHGSRLGAGSALGKGSALSYTGAICSIVGMIRGVGNFPIYHKYLHLPQGNFRFAPELCHMCQPPAPAFSL
jgi:hypothetical protein